MSPNSDETLENSISMTLNIRNHGDWQSDQDLESRWEMAKQIVEVLKHWDGKNVKPEWLIKVPQMVTPLEVSLYRSASSFQEYSDTSTLKSRLQQIVIQIEKQSKDQEIHSSDTTTTTTMKKQRNGSNGPSQEQDPMMGKQKHEMNARETRSEGDGSRNDEHMKDKQQKSVRRQSSSSSSSSLSFQSPSFSRDGVQNCQSSQHPYSSHLQSSSSERTNYSKSSGTDSPSSLFVQPDPLSIYNQSHIYGSNSDLQLTSAGKEAAEKRATAALRTLRIVAYQRSQGDVCKSAVDCAVGIAAGRIPSSYDIEDKAFRLIVNEMRLKLGDIVMASATNELEMAASYAISQNDDEKFVMEKVRKPVLLFMVLCVRQSDMIKTLMSISSRENAGVLSKAVRSNMPMFAKYASRKYGAATITMKVAEMVDDNEIPMLLAFLDNLAPKTKKEPPTSDLIEVCHQIQATKLDSSGKKDPRYIIPIVSGMKRVDLVNKFAEFIGASDVVYKAALKRMSERVGRHLLMFREEPNRESPSLLGMTLCEQLVYLHRLDFASVGLSQKRYLNAIEICLREDEIFTDRVIMAALDHISNKFLEGLEGLPLSYMRTTMLTCSRHESLHPWICHVLLPRLIEGKVYAAGKRQWEGWMRCARMLESSADGGISSIQAIQKLPPEQLRMYREKYPDPIF